MPGARIEETTMLLNHKHSIEYLLGNISNVSVSKIDILNVHALLSDGLLRDPSDSGKLRVRPVGIGKSSYTPLDFGHEISEEFSVVLDVCEAIKDPFDKSIYLFLNLAYLQPFFDVNKRTARMVSNIPLLKAGLMPMSFFQMSRKGYELGLIHYYETGDFRRMVKEYVCIIQNLSRKIS
jgi:Fic family protein